MGRPIEGNVVDVRTGEIFPGRILHRGGVILRVERIPGPCDGFLVPGFIDSHIHVDSSLLCPSRFAEAAVPHGTTAVVTDPHEIANVLGTAGIDFMRKDASSVPLRVFFTAPSCVPATPFETSGASLGPAEVEALLRGNDVVALGEVMDYRGAVAGRPDLLAKIAAARRAGKPVDGHCPLLSGKDLAAYAALGISTDHECTGAGEALEKHLLGMRVMVREGSAARNLEALAPFAREHDFILVSDDLIAPDLASGHLDATLSRAVSLGVDPLHALRAVTLRPADHYGLPLGAIEPGRMADIARVDDLSKPAVSEVHIGGVLAARGGKPAFAAHPLPMGGTIAARPVRGEDFRVPAAGPGAVVRVIGLVRDQIVTTSEHAVPRVVGRRLLPDPARDILLLAVVNRYREEPPAVGFVRGLGLRSGAIASSVAHDSHNLIVAGADPGDMAGAVNTLIRERGGLCLYAGGTAVTLPLRIAGLMSAEPLGDVLSRHASLHAAAREAGCIPERPFLALSFLSLLVIPHLKIGDRGLFDADAGRFVDAVVPKAS